MLTRTMFKVQPTLGIESTQSDPVVVPERLLVQRYDQRFVLRRVRGEMGGLGRGDGTYGQPSSSSRQKRQRGRRLTVGVKHDRYEVGEVTQSPSSSFFPLFPTTLTLVGTRPQGEGMVVGFAAAATAAHAFGVEIPQKCIGSYELIYPRRIPIIRSLNKMALSPRCVYPRSRRSSSEETGECGRSGTGDEGRYAVVGCAELQG